MVMAENRQFNPNNANEQISTPVSKSVLETLDTRKELAKTVGVGEVTMGRAMKIADEAPQNVKDAVDSGELTIGQGYNITKKVRELPEDEQEQAAARAIEYEKPRRISVNQMQRSTAGVPSLSSFAPHMKKRRTWKPQRKASGAGWNLPA